MLEKKKTQVRLSGPVLILHKPKFRFLTVFTVVDHGLKKDQPKCPSPVGFVSPTGFLHTSLNHPY